MKNVFLLEDNALMRAAVKSILKPEGYSIECFKNTNLFLTRLQIKLPDLVILDILLPDGDGRQVCKMIKRNPKTKHIPIVMMSAFFKPDEMALDECANAYLEKPFEPEDLRYVVKRAF